MLPNTIYYALRGVSASGRWVGRRAHGLRVSGGGGEIGMIRMLDLHAASCAGDTLVTLGLAGTIFFSVPAGEARGKVALYLLITMAPFALLAPLVGPLLDRFRHGRRYALAATMLGRAFLAWLISDYLFSFGLYPAAFGVLVLSRAYGVARSAAVPRLLPAGLGLSEAGARASVYGAVAGILVAPIGVVAVWIGPQWPLRIATVIFVIGMVIALRLPAPADSAPPESVPRIFTMPGRGTRKVLSNRLVTATIAGSAGLRLLFGFLTLYLAFAIRSRDLSGDFVGFTLGPVAALGVVGGALGGGSLLATGVGTRLRIRRPAQLQALALAAVAVSGVIAAAVYSLASVAMFCLVASAASGLSKLAADATIQERVDEEVRASAFAHSETLQMLAFVLGGALGLIPFGGRLGVLVAAAVAVATAVRAGLVAARLRRERLTGAAATEKMPGPAATPPAATPPAATATVSAPTPAAAPARQQEQRRRGWRSRSARDERGPRTDPATTRLTEPGAGTTTEPGVGTPAGAAPGLGDPHPTRVIERTDEDLPTYHLYRPGTPPNQSEPGTDG